MPLVPIRFALIVSLVTPLSILEAPWRFVLMANSRATHGLTDVV